MMRGAFTALALLAMAGAAEAQQRQTIDFESRQKGQPVRVTAEIYWPAGQSVVPAMVIHHGSGGISDQREGRYARELTAIGVAAVVIDSFRPRGVSSTVEDQSAVSGPDFNLDALGALKALGATSRIDRNRIGIMGFSKGGTSALMASHLNLLAAAAVSSGLRYALHVPFYPSCATQYYRPRTTGQPIHLLLGSADTYVGVEPCTTYAEALRANGAQIEVKVYPGAGHGFDGGRAYFTPRGENYSQCVFQQQPDGSFVERKSGVTTNTADGKPVQGALAKAQAACRTLGVSGGLQEAAAAQSLVDLKSYVRHGLQGGG
ncbi:dienelactone hydrolase family protein [Reyranella sp.]|uniref:dienelactone hydrolase family protein n=1 Tax=Reyranella sp. TaxID=1929291 RepID=UPI003783D867